MYWTLIFGQSLLWCAAYLEQDICCQLVHSGLLLTAVRLLLVYPLQGDGESAIKDRGIGDGTAHAPSPVGLGQARWRMGCQGGAGRTSAANCLLPVGHEPALCRVTVFIKGQKLGFITLRRLLLWVSTRRRSFLVHNE